MTTCLDCGSDGASRVELYANDSVMKFHVLGEWCPACAESIQRIQGAALLYWLIRWHRGTEDARRLIGRGTQ